MRPNKNILKTRAKELRVKATQSELLFRMRLIDFDIPHKFQMVIGFYIVDFFFPRSGLIIEVDGAIHDSRKEYDARRDKWLRQFGFTIWRIKNEDVENYRLKRILLMPARKKTGNDVRRANMWREQTLRVQNEADKEIWVRKAGEKSGFIKQVIPVKIERPKSKARSIKVIKKA